MVDFHRVAPPLQLVIAGGFRLHRNPRSRNDRVGGIARQGRRSRLAARDRMGNCRRGRQRRSHRDRPERPRRLG